MVVLVDAKYFGKALRYARRQQGLNMTDVANMFGISRKQWRKYEHGCEPISESILHSLFYHGFCSSRCTRSHRN